MVVSSPAPSRDSTDVSDGYQGDSSAGAQGKEAFQNTAQCRGALCSRKCDLGFFLPVWINMDLLSA